MPEDMSDRMPEDLPVTKRIDAMVGITRSKVIGCDFLFHMGDRMWYVNGLIFTHINTYIHRYIHTYIRTYMHTYIYIYMFIYIYLFKYIDVKTSNYVYKYIYIYIMCSMIV